ncbi:tudor domain-containing protein 6 [Pelodytes ibericus]
MSASPGLPVPGSTVKLRISYVEASAEVSLVRLWGSFGEHYEEYQRLRSELQSAAPTLPQRRPPAIGEFCVVEVNGLWQRCKVVQCQGAEYKVYLIDQGHSSSAGAHQLRLAPANVFKLPPEVVGYILFNLVPQEQKRWSIEALRYLSSLQGQEVDGLVQDLILPQGLVLLEVPTVKRQLLELGLARLLPDDSFRSLLFRFLAPMALNHQRPEGPTVCPVSISNPMPGTVMGPQLPPTNPSWGMDYYYPHIQVGFTEPVLVTQVSDPQRIFCQLRSLSHEIQHLSESMQQHYEMQSGCVEPTVPHSFVLGQPCAARGTDGRWHRSLLQEYIPDKFLAVVTHVDWGRKDVVPVSSLRSLAPDYFRMPVVTFPCCLYGVSDGGAGWDASMLFELRSLLYGRQLSAKIEYYNSYEHLYVVNLFADDGANLNCVYIMRVQTLKVCHANTLAAENFVPIEDAYVKGNVKIPEAPQAHFYVPVVSIAELSIGTFYDALVEFVCDPSNFWIRTAEHAARYKEVMNAITTLYSQASKLEGIIAKPQKGQLCCTKFRDKQYYRAEVIANYGKQVEVYFIDHGNTEIVDWYDVKELPAQFKDLPGLAIHCCVADIYPLGESWSSEAILAFKVAVFDKKLVVYVLSKESNKYIIEVLDQSRTEERSVSKILSSAGHANFEEYEPVPNPIKPLSATSGRRKDFQSGNNASHLSDCKIRKKPAIQSTGDNTGSIQYCPFEAQHFEPGTTIEVIVSCVDNPGLFWCQNVAHMSKLRTLMNKIQEFCSNTSCPFDGSTSCCLARSPSDRLWYRAFITKLPRFMSDSETAEVFYVDYGTKDVVSTKELRLITKEFFEVKALAFKCSLYNLIAPLGTSPFKWDKRATVVFNDFVENSSTIVHFSCTFFATASVEKEIFNIVNLFTPFTSICDLLIEQKYATRLSHKLLDPSVQLHSYFYSMHDIKIGSEERIYITHITSSLEFYCQLSRNTKIIQKIASMTAHMSSDPQSRMSQNPGPLCLAKFTDQQWYRGYVRSSAGNPEVFFVDFGNTDKVDSSDLIPQNSYELLLFPMQAVKCSLSDIPSEVPSEIVTWFESTALDKPLKALVVAKETDGKLMVELYDGLQQVNAIIKTKLGLKSPKTRALSQSNSECNNEVKYHTRKNLGGEQEQSKYSGSETVVHNTERKELTPLLRALPHTPDSNVAKVNVSPDVKPKRRSPSPYKQPDLLQTGTSKPSQAQLSDLPKSNIFPGLKASVYVSHINTVYDFYVQMAQDAELCHISEILNNEKISEGLSGDEVHMGDLVCAFFADDELNYRAVITEKSSDGLHVQYIDYGNASVVPVDKISRLSERLLSFPVMGFHCTFLNLPVSAPNAEDLLLKFTEITNDAQLKCDFVQHCGDKWEVQLFNEHGCIKDYLMANSGEPLSIENIEETLYVNVPGASSEEEGAVPCSLFVWDLPQPGETVEAYASAVDGPEHFWCQLSASSEIDELAVKIQDAGVHSVEDENFYSVLNIGSPCNVKYSDDGNWYRAIITSTETERLRVRFVDYGNEDTVGIEQVRQLPSSLRIIPVQAFPCCLAGFNFSEGCWSSEANTFFFQRVTEDILEVTILEIQQLGISNIPVASVNVKYKRGDINREMAQFWNVGNPAKSSETRGESEPKINNHDRQDYELSLNPEASTAIDKIHEEINVAEHLKSATACAFPAEDALETYAGDPDDQDMQLSGSLEVIPKESLFGSGEDEVMEHKDPERNTDVGVMSKPEYVNHSEMCLVQDLAGLEDSHGEIDGDKVSDTENTADLKYSQASYDQDSLSEPYVSQTELCDADFPEGVFSSVVEDYGYLSEQTVDEAEQWLFQEVLKMEKKATPISREKNLPGHPEAIDTDFPECQVAVSDPGIVFDGDVCEAEFSVLDDGESRDLQICTVYPDSVNQSDVCLSRDDEQERETNQELSDLSVYTESCVSVDGINNVCEIVCQPEYSHLDSEGNQDFQICTESPAPVGPDRVSQSDVILPHDDEEGDNPDLPVYTESQGMLSNDNQNEVNQDLSVYTESCVSVDSMGYVCEIVSQSESSSAESTGNQDLEICTESPSPVRADRVNQSDVFLPRDYDQEREANQDLSVYTESCVSVGGINNVCEIVCQPEYSPLDSEGNQDLSVYSESQGMLPDDNQEEATRGVQISTVSALPVEADSVDQSDVCLSREEDQKREANQDLSVYTESCVSVGGINNVCEIVCQPEYSPLDSEGNQDLSVYSESQGMLRDDNQEEANGDLSLYTERCVSLDPTEYICEIVSKPEDSSTDSTGNQDFQICTESPALVEADSVNQSDVGLPRDDSQDASNQDLSVYTERCVSVDSMECVCEIVSQSAASSAESTGNQGFLICTESPAPVGADSGNQSDVFLPRADDQKREVDQEFTDLSVYTESCVSVDGINNVYEIVCQPEDHHLDSEGSQGLSVDSESLGMLRDDNQEEAYHDLSLYTERCVSVDPTEGICEIVSQSEASSADSTGNQGFQICTESPSPVGADSVCLPRDDQERETSQDFTDFSVYTESCVSVDGINNVCEIVCQPEYSHLDSERNQDLSVCSESLGVARDDSQEEANRDLSLYTESCVSVDPTECICEIVSPPETSSADSTGNQAVSAYTESCLPLEVPSDVLEMVIGQEASGPESKGNQDLLVDTECSLPVDMASDVCDIVTQSEIYWTESTGKQDLPAPSDGSVGDGSEMEADCLRKVDDEGLTRSHVIFADLLLCAENPAPADDLDNVDPSGGFEPETVDNTALRSPHVGPNFGYINLYIVDMQQLNGRRRPRSFSEPESPINKDVNEGLPL